jgi:hypothetical protein
MKYYLRGFDRKTGELKFDREVLSSEVSLLALKHLEALGEGMLWVPRSKLLLLGIDKFAAPWDFYLEAEQ